MENIVLAVFDTRTKALQAMSKLGELQDAGRLQVDQAIVVHRTSDGRLAVDEESPRMGPAATATGGLVGGAIGALGGPLTLLLGGIAGVLIGNVVDEDENRHADLLLETAAGQIPPDSHVVAADVVEQTEAPFDSAVTALGGVVVRWPRGAVEKELGATDVAPG